MLRLRISRPARHDLASILATSLERWGEEARSRYAALFAAALRAIAANPDGPTKRERSELAPSLRSFHVRNVRRLHGVKNPVHIIYCRPSTSTIDIVRVLHERMEPMTRVGVGGRKPRKSKR